MPTESKCPLDWEEMTRSLGEDLLDAVTSEHGKENVVTFYMVGKAVDEEEQLQAKCGGGEIVGG